MELPIRLVIVIVVLVVVALVVLSLIGLFGERSNWMIEGIFGFFDNLFGGSAPPPKPL